LENMAKLEPMLNKADKVTETLKTVGKVTK